MKTSEIKRLLRKAGCTVSREGANHEIWFSPKTGEHFPVPRHNGQELKTKTAESIMRAAGLK